MLYFRGKMRNAQGWVDSEYKVYSIGVYHGDFPNPGTRTDNISLGDADLDETTNIAFVLTALNESNHVDGTNGYQIVVDENVSAYIYRSGDSIYFVKGNDTTYISSAAVYSQPPQYGSLVFDSDDLNIVTKYGSIYYRKYNNNPAYSIYGGSTSNWNLIKEILELNPYTPEPENTDPYNPGGSSGSGGGTGSFDGASDNIDIPGLPTLSATSTSFITLFNPSITQLNELSNFMWSSGFDIETFKKLFANPMDCILGLSIVPVAVPNGETSIISVGNISTGVSMTKAASQYVTVDCGTLNVNEYWGAYLDYDPYTKAEIYLPYIGTHALSVDDIMGKSIHVVYHVDILSGACAAYVKCGGSVLYTFIGQCSSSIPISGNDWTNVINGVLSIAGAVGSMVATGGASAPMAAGMIASTAVNGLKPNVEKSGSMSGTGGMLGIQTPYLILTRPRQALPARQNTFTGYPSFITSKLGSLSGYTEIEEIHLENIPGTEQEISEIENLLKGGVII